MFAAVECVGALIFDPAGRMFVQRRSPSRSLFPNCWDAAGGHVEPGETPLETLRREVFEETGWTVEEIHAALEPIRWRGDDGHERLEHDFLVSVQGDLDRPVLEEGKQSEWKWITSADTHLLDQHRRLGDELIKDLIREGFAKAQELGLTPPFPAVIATVVDRVFLETMRAARDRSTLPPAGGLIDYRLILPARPLGPSERDILNRYSDPAALHEGFLELQDRGLVSVAPDETVSVTDAGREFYRKLWALHASVAGERLGDMPLLASVLERVSPGPAFAAVYPPYLPDSPTPALRAFANLAVLRYQRADAHAAAWQAAGLSAGEVVALAAGRERDAIEAVTNEIAGQPYLDLTVKARFALLDEIQQING